MQSSERPAPKFPVLYNKTDLNFIAELKKNPKQNQKWMTDNKTQTNSADTFNFYRTAINRTCGKKIIQMLFRNRTRRNTKLMNVIRIRNQDFLLSF